MAGGTGRRCGIVFANNPGIRIQVHLLYVLQLSELNPLLGFSIDFQLGMIGTYMAFAARRWLICIHQQPCSLPHQVVDC